MAGVPYRTPIECVVAVGTQLAVVEHTGCFLTWAMDHVAPRAAKTVVFAHGRILPRGGETRRTVTLIANILAGSICKKQLFFERTAGDVHVKRVVHMLEAAAPTNALWKQYYKQHWLTYAVLNNARLRPLFAAELATAIVLFRANVRHAAKNECFLSLPFLPREVQWHIMTFV